jgi:hypothetical protein
MDHVQAFFVSCSPRPIVPGLRHAYPPISELDKTNRAAHGNADRVDS